LSAELLFRQATKYDPGFATAFVNLGVTLASESKFREADLALQKALQIDPDNKDARRAHILVKAQLERQSPGSE
jgi:cytochrome c-type biogenesis protein CcmH/NrfG